jgi:SAM-dependent methyltransferase
MQRTDALFSGSIPALYDRYLGGLLFEPYADDLAHRVRNHRTGAVLELAAGTGIVTRALARTLPTTVEIVATDLNPAMLDHAATKLDARNVRWQQADATSLPFDDASFALLVCQFGVMFFPDKPTAFREAARVLAPHGCYWFNVWHGLPANPLAKIIHDTVAAAFPDDPPGFLGRTPFAYFDVGVIEESLYDAGFRSVDVEVVDKRSCTEAARDVATGYVQGSPLRGEIEARDASRLAELTDASTDAIAAQFGGGAIDAPMRALVIRATL